MLVKRMLARIYTSENSWMTSPYVEAEGFSTENFKEYHDAGLNAMIKAWITETIKTLEVAYHIEIETVVFDGELIQSKEIQYFYEW